MKQKLSQRAFHGHGPIQILYPGEQISGTDTGIGSIGRIDHARVRGRQYIAMHPHVNDEILSYFRTGEVEHIDSEGFKKTVGGKRLMLMKAGKEFYHEEYIHGEKEPFEGLQIFIRPGKKDLTPQVIFQDLDELHSEDHWRLIASPSSETPLQFSSQTWIYDVKLSAGSSIALPPFPVPQATALLYVFKGAIETDEAISLQQQEALVFANEYLMIHALNEAELVLFFTDENSAIYKQGMFSGNQSMS